MVELLPSVLDYPGSARYDYGWDDEYVHWVSKGMRTMMTGWPKSERGSLRCLRGVLMMADGEVHMLLVAMHFSPIQLEFKSVRWKVAQEHETTDLVHLDFSFPFQA